MSCLTSCPALAGILAILISHFAAAATYHVSPSGDDTSPGTSDKPFKTISRAAQIAGPGDTVLIAPGTYRQWVAVTHSGTPDHPILFQAEKTGSVIISGADVLADWLPVPHHPGWFVTDWPHDFYVGANHDGSKIRNHGAPAPIGCAEQVIWNSRPLTQVMQPEELAPGDFFVDWNTHHLTIFLPGGIDPRTTQIEGSTRSHLFSPLEQFNKLSDIRYITIQGIVFRYAANFAQRGGVILGTGWYAQDCIVECNNAGGMLLHGDNITVQRVTCQYNGFTGIGGTGSNLLVEDCTIHDNNRKGFPISWDGGGGKFTHTDHLQVVHHRSYDNTGPGIWLDGTNTNYSIRDSAFIGNHGLRADWEGIGIFVEISPGPGLISGNMASGNSGSGITLAESQQISVEGNTLVHNGACIELRAMEGRGNNRLENLMIANNRFGAWRNAAIETSLGLWTPDSINSRKIAADSNIYNPPPQRPLIQWAGHGLADLNDVRSFLGFEKSGEVSKFQYVEPSSDPR